MGKYFSRINVPTFVAVIAFIVADKKLGISDRIVARI